MKNNVKRMIKMKIVEMFRVNRIHDICVKNSLFTLGTNEEYQEMFDMIDRKDFSHELLEKVACYIEKYSNTEMDEVDIAGEILRDGIERYVQ